jgi:hypothetical protein
MKTKLLAGLLLGASVLSAAPRVVFGFSYGAPYRPYYYAPAPVYVAPPPAYGYYYDQPYWVNGYYYGYGPHRVWVRGYWARRHRR